MTPAHPCLNGHDRPEQFEHREDGSRVCLACRAMYYGQRRLAAKPTTAPNRETRTDAARR